MHGRFFRIDGPTLRRRQWPPSTESLGGSVALLTSLLKTLLFTTGFCQWQHGGTLLRWGSFTAVSSAKRRRLSWIYFLFKENAREVHPTKPLVRLHARQLADPVKGRETEIFKRSMFGFVAVYNRLPVELVGCQSVKAFHSRRSKAIAAQARMGTDGWQDMLSHRNRTGDIRLFHRALGCRSAWRCCTCCCFLAATARAPSADPSR